MSNSNPRPYTREYYDYFEKEKSGEVEGYVKRYGFLEKLKGKTIEGLI